MVSPDDHTNSPISESISWSLVVVGWDNDDWSSVFPFFHESFNFGVFLELGVHQDSIGSSINIGVGSLEGFFESPSSDEGFNSRDDLEIGIGLSILASSDLILELFNIS